ncbi:MAG: alpha/beta hydrolase [Calditrichaeota bacterium]|nr:alpha/beta hydrolase [Calditrichota bacterium]
MKTVFKIVGILAVIVIIAGGVIYYFMQQPMYKPGMVNQGQNLRSGLNPPSQIGQDSLFWQVEDDIKLYHTAQGSGEDVLIIHGGPGIPYAKHWSGLDSLLHNYAFHYYHQRGAGKSSKPFDKFQSQNYYDNMQLLERTLGLGAQIADIERIRQILGKEKLTLIGHSFGAFLASLYAAEFPERVKALVLIAPADVMVLPSETGLFEQVNSMLPEDERQNFAVFMEKYLDFSNLFSKSEKDLANNQIEFGRYYAMAIKSRGIQMPEFQMSENDIAGWAVYAMYFSMGQSHDYSSYFTEINVPTLVIHGGEDIQSEETSKKYNSYFSGSEFVKIENAGHFPFYSQPESFASAVNVFLEKTNLGK